LKILSIGDIHGLDVWKKFGDIPQLITYAGFEPEFDYYVFVGDYTDSFTKSNEDIFNNLNEIVGFKEHYPDKVILLLGNHDLQYYFGTENHKCTGFRPEAYFDLHEVFRNKRKLFQAAFQINKYIWTHGGIHKGWYDYEFPYKSPNIADDINNAFEEYNKTLFNVGRSRGGWSSVGGPFWLCRFETQSNKIIRGYHQIVGHTRSKGLIRLEYKKTTSITYIDYLEDGLLEPYILEI